MYGSNVDVYLPKNHPYQIIPNPLVHLWGYNQGTCRILIVGSICSPLASHYQIIRIHYSPHKALISPHEIDISLKKVFNCSIKCSLNVGIWEYMDINNKTRSRYHEWQGIYRLTWQLIVAKSRGISVTINSTCEACIKLCDIAVALGLPLRNNMKTLNGEGNSVPSISGSFLKTTSYWTDILQSELLGFMGHGFMDKLHYYLLEEVLSEIANPMQDITSQDTMLHGSWYDAHAYCLSKNSSLFDLAPSLSGHLKRLMDSKVVQHGWKYSQELFFAGLHYDNMVCISIKDGVL